MASATEAKATSVEDHPEDWLTTKETAAVLAVSESAVRRMVRNEELPSANAGGSIRVPRAAVEQLAQQTDPLERRPGEDSTALVERLSGTSLRKLPLLLMPEDVEKLLSIPRSTVYSMLRAGELPCRTVGRTKRVPLPALIIWLTEAA